MQTARSFYLHIPFCIHKCVYCAFCSGFKPEQSMVENYINALCREITLLAQDHPPAANLKTLYLGGGTPSLLSPSQLEHILDTLRRYFPLSGHAEVTLEANPEDLTADLSAAWKDLGINRVSLGLQSMEENILTLLERRNTVSHNLAAVDILRRTGFNNISGDIILNIPGMNLEKSLLPMLDIGLTHISAYTLTIEEGAELYRLHEEGDFQTMNDLEAVEQYRQTVIFLRQKGFHQYEISNFALEEHFQSRHNTNYWDYGPYYGAGLGASGTLWTGDSLIRAKNTENMRLYLANTNRLPPREEENLDRDTRIREYLMLNLRKTQGVSLVHFKKLFGISLYDILRKENLQEMEGLIKWDSRHLRLTKPGQEIANPLTIRIWDMLPDLL